MVEKSQGLFTGELGIRQQGRRGGSGKEREWKNGGEGIISGWEMEEIGVVCYSTFLKIRIRK